MLRFIGKKTGDDGLSEDFEKRLHVNENTPFTYTLTNSTEAKTSTRNAGPSRPRVFQNASIAEKVATHVYDTPMHGVPTGPRSLLLSSKRHAQIPTGFAPHCLGPVHHQQRHLQILTGFAPHCLGPVHHQQRHAQIPTVYAPHCLGPTHQQRHLQPVNQQRHNKIPTGFTPHCLGPVHQQQRHSQIPTGYAPHCLGRVVHQQPPQYHHRRSAKRGGRSLRRYDGDATTGLRGQKQQQQHSTSLALPPPSPTTMSSIRKRTTSYLTLPALGKRSRVVAWLDADNNDKATKTGDGLGVILEEGYNNDDDDEKKAEEEWKESGRFKRQRQRYSDKMELKS